MKTCKEYLYKDGVLSAFKHQNPFGMFEKLGFIKTQKDAWKTKKSTKGWVKVQTGFEEWQIDVLADTPEKYQEFLSNLRDNGIHTLSYMSRLSTPFGKSTMRLGTFIEFGTPKKVNVRTSKKN